MDLGLLIQQLRQNASVFQNRVGGAAEFANALDITVNMPLPSAYVIPLEDRADDNILQNGLNQQVTERIGVIVEVSTADDRRGQTAAMFLETLKYDVHAAILNWRIDPIRAQKGLQYAGGRLLDFDRARLFWQLEYELLVTIDDDDGFQITGIELAEIETSIEVGDQSYETTVFFEDDTFAVTPPMPIPQANLTVGPMMHIATTSKVPVANAIATTSA